MQPLEAEQVDIFSYWILLQLNLHSSLEHSVISKFRKKIGLFSNSQDQNNICDISRYL